MVRIRMKEKKGRTRITQRIVEKFFRHDQRRVNDIIYFQMKTTIVKMVRHCILYVWVYINCQVESASFLSFEFFQLKKFICKQLFKINMGASVKSIPIYYCNNNKV